VYKNTLSLYRLMVSTSRLRAPAGLQIDLYVDWDATAFFLSRRLHAQPRETEREKSTVVLFRRRFCCRVLLPPTLFGRYQLYMRSRRIVNHARSQ